MNIVFFDSDCLMCNSFISRVDKQDINNKLLYSALQGEFAKRVFKEKKMNHSMESIVFISGPKIYTESDAIIEILLFANKRMKYFKIGYIVPKVIRDAVYRVISRNRRKFNRRNRMCEINQNLTRKIIK